MIAAPPIGVMQVVERFSPGFWMVFFSKANRALAGVDVYLTSWHRTAWYNETVGGLEDSQHILGTAFDIAGPGVGTAAPRLQAEGFVVVPYADGHLHAQAWPAGAARRAGVFAALGL